MMIFIIIWQQRSDELSWFIWSSRRQARTTRSCLVTKNVNHCLTLSESPALSLTLTSERSHMMKRPFRWSTASVKYLTPQIPLSLFLSNRRESALNGETKPHRTSRPSVRSTLFDVFRPAARSLHPACSLAFSDQREIVRNRETLPSLNYTAVEYHHTLFKLHAISACLTNERVCGMERVERVDYSNKNAVDHVTHVQSAGR